MYRKTLIKVACFVIVGVLTAIDAFQSQQVYAQTPVAFLVSPYFGTETVTQNYNVNHHAIDFGMSYRRVLAAEGGNVYHVEWHNNLCHQFWNPNGDFNNCGYGLNARIEYANGYRTYYAHLSTVAFNLGTINDDIGKGQIIGTSGHTGYSSGPHLHFETQHNIGGVWSNVNPFDESGVSLWEDGQWADPSHPIPESPVSSETIIDDNTTNSSGFSKGRGNPFVLPCPPNTCPAWTRSTAAGYSGDMYYTLTQGDNLDYWAMWAPADFPNGGGLYEIWVYVPASHDTTWRARYTVWHDDGLGGTIQRTAVVDQEGTDNHWVSIGVYAMRADDYVYTTSATGTAQGEPGRELAVDAVKFTRLDVNYAPLYKQGGGWSSILTVRNNGGPATVRWMFNNSDGSQRCLYTRYLNANQTYTHSCTGAASVVVESTQDVSMSFLLEHGLPFASAAYVGVENPDAAAMVPLVHRSNYGWHSEISLQNTANEAKTVELIFQPSVSCGLSLVTIPANGTLIIDTATLNCLGSNYVGSMRVSRNNTPLAVADMQYTTTYNSLIASAAVVNPAITLYAPLIQQNNYGWTSGFNLQNATGQYRTLTAAYYRSGGTTCPNLDEFSSVGPYHVITQYPAPSVTCTGDAVLSARFYSSGNMNGQVNQIILGDTKASGYRAISEPTTKAVVPYVRRNSTWGTGLQIRNAGGGTASVTIRYYSSSGNFVSEETRSIPVNGTTTVYPVQPAAPFYGSATVECTNGYPIAVAVNHLKIAAGATGDTIMSHIAPNW